MCLFVVEKKQALTDAINSFDASYHADYFSVRGLAKVYLSSSAPTQMDTNALACVLHVVLKRYGAEKQKAPTRRSIAEMEKALLDGEIFRLLQFFSAHSLITIGVDAGVRTSAANILDTDNNLVRVLRLLGERLFTNNTNVTYPMKALMLITGYMPALDSQVKSGLADTGISGINTTQFLLPDSANELRGKKITRLPYILAACYANPVSRAIIDNAIQASQYKSLAAEIGRVFDVLLFMQAKGQRHLLAYESQHVVRWYDLA